MVQDAPLSGVNLSVPLLARIARELPNVAYFKIEVPGTAGKLRGLIEAGGDAYLGGNREAAAAQYARILPLINHENRQCNLRACKTVMCEGGVIASDAVRHPLEPLPAAAREELLRLASDLDLLALRWGK